MMATQEERRRRATWIMARTTIAAHTSEPRKEAIMNTELLLRVKQHILEEPSRLDMEDYYYQLGDVRYQPPFGEPTCGTVACIAGLALLLEGKRPKRTKIGDAFMKATALLKISRDEASRLFFLSCWPNDLWKAYSRAAAQHKGAAAALSVGKRIDLFIASDGRM
mgnify:FL=1